MLAEVVLPGAVVPGTVLEGAVSVDDDPPVAPELPDEHAAPRTRNASPNEETRSPRFDTAPSSQLVAPNSCDPTQPTGWHAVDASQGGLVRNVAEDLRVPFDAMRALVTGGAGFIGSHIVDALLARGDEVVVLDDLETGFRENVEAQARLLIGSVADEAAVRDAVRGCDVVFHQAAHKAVMRSIESPLATDTVNVHGTLTVLQAAVDAGVGRVVHASSSSVYGGATRLPTPEDETMLPRSPYAVSKLAAEHYCRVFTELHGLETVALRYFNVYGPRQRPDATYAAVIPLFVDALLAGRSPKVYGDGLQSRDFTYVSDVVDANLAAAGAVGATSSGRVYNIAGGASWTLLDILGTLGALLGVEPRPTFMDSRPGDVRHSRADASRAASDLGFRCRVDLQEGLRRTVDWLRSIPAKV